MATFSNMISVFFLVLFVNLASSSQYGLTESINKFSTYIFKEVSWDGNHGGNNFFTSALSAHIMLTLLSFGAKGQTLQDMDKGLFITNPNDKDDYKEAIVKMKTYMNLWNKMYVGVNPENVPNPNFLEKATEIFQTLLEPIDFDQGDVAAAQINAWVEINTGLTIKNFAQASDFNNKTSIGLVNTLYYKGNWENTFNQAATKKEEFFVNPGVVILVDTMNQECQTNYGENTNLQAQILQLAFKGYKTSMVFILPNKLDGLQELEENLKKQDMQELVQSLQPENVIVSLPKFKIQTSANLNNGLSNLGMGNIFTNNADFGGVLANPITLLKVGKVFQKAFLDLNENGITASGAIGEYVEKKNIFPKKRHIPKEFKANHPYFFAMFNDDNQMVFSGHFTGKSGPQGN